MPIHPKATIYAFKPCLEARGLSGATLDKRTKLGRMTDSHAVANAPDARIGNF